MRVRRMYAGLYLPSHHIPAPNAVCTRTCYHWRARFVRASPRARRRPTGVECARDGRGGGPRAWRCIVNLVPSTGNQARLRGCEAARQTCSCLAPGLVGGDAADGTQAHGDAPTTGRLWRRRLPTLRPLGPCHMAPWHHVHGAPPHVDGRLQYPDGHWGARRRSRGPREVDERPLGDVAARRSLSRSARRREGEREAGPAAC